MALCAFAGNADMYGLGIRLGYYLQWYGGIFASLLAPEEVPNARFALGLFISATFLALVIQTVQNDLHAVEIYIILLLTFGAYLFLVPQLLWRLVTGCQPLLDPSRFPLVDPGPTHSDLHTVLILAVTGYQLWFWFVKIPGLDKLYCKRYGFAFAKVPLNNRAFQVINIILYFVLGVAVLVLSTLRLNSVTKGPEYKRRRADQWERDKERLGRRRLSRRVNALQKLNMVNNIVTATIVVVATELTIKWNRITDVNTLSSAGQLIPFVIGLGVVVRVLYVWRKPGPRRSPSSYSQLPPHVPRPRDPFLIPPRSSILPTPLPLPEYTVVTPMSHRQPPERTSSLWSSGSSSQPRRSNQQYHTSTPNRVAQTFAPAPVSAFQPPDSVFRPQELPTSGASYRAPRASTDTSPSISPHPTAPLPASQLPPMAKRKAGSGRSVKKGRER